VVDGRPDTSSSRSIRPPVPATVFRLEYAVAARDLPALKNTNGSGAEAPPRDEEAPPVAAAAALVACWSRRAKSSALGISQSPPLYLRRQHPLPGSSSARNQHPRPRASSSTEPTHQQGPPPQPPWSSTS